MNFSQLITAAKAVPGLSKMLGGGLDSSVVQNQLAKLGITPQAIQEFAQEAQVLLADGKITPAEIKAHLEPIAVKKGIPVQVVDALITMMQSQRPKQ